MVTIVLLAATVAQAPLAIQIVRNGATKPAINVTAGPDERISLVVEVTAPDQRELEMPEIEAENQAPGYFSEATRRPGPNVFLHAERVDGAGTRQPVSVRITSSGGGQSLRRYYRSVDFHILAAADERRARIRKFLDQFLAQLNSSTNPEVDQRAKDAGRQMIERAKQDPGLAVWDQMYIGNPPGTYRVTIEYRPRGGPFAGKTLRQQFTLRIENGPDTLDRYLTKVR